MTITDQVHQAIEKARRRPPKAVLPSRKVAMLKSVAAFLRRQASGRDHQGARCVSWPCRWSSWPR